MQMLPEHEATLAGWLLPIPGDSPVGGDARYDAAYELIRAELTKLDSVTGLPVGWESVRAAADQLLKSRTKDVFVAAALTRALQVEAGLSGLVLGLSLMARLTAEFGDALYPARARARASAYDWLVQQSARELGEQPVVRDAAALVPALEAGFAAFCDGAQALLGDLAPNLSPLRDAIARTALAAAERAEAAPTPERVAAANVQGSVDPAPPAPTQAPHAKPVSRAPATAALTLEATAAAPADVAEVGEYLSRTGAKLVEAARLLWKQDRSAPTPYRLMRTALWLHLDAPPAHDASGRSSIPTPDERLVETLSLLLQNARWEELLESAEASLPSARFWLDLHLYCDRALEGLGPPYAAARAAAAAGVGALLARMPALPTLRFDDGTPLAGRETCDFLRRLGSGAAEPGGPSHVMAEELAIEDLRASLRGGRDATLAEVDQRRASCASGRARFRLDLTLARALTEVELGGVAVPLFEALEREVGQHELELWEPALALELLTHYCRCLSKLAAADETASSKQQTIRARIAKLSPATLVSLAD